MISQNYVLNNQFLDFQIFAIENVDTLLGKCSGNNDKKLFIVCSSTEKKGEDVNFLQKILGAVHLDIQKDVLLLHVTPSEQFSFIELCKKVDIETAILFGLSPRQAGLNLNIPPYHPLRFADKTFLLADNLQKLQTNLPLKKALWGCLQELFLKEPLDKEERT